MYYTIYRITHKPTGKVYIGKHQTINLDDGYFGSGKRLKRAITKHGIDQFEKKILFTFTTEEEMNTKERELVTEEFCRRKDTYNICEGGKGGFGFVNRLGMNNKGGLRGVALLTDGHAELGRKGAFEKFRRHGLSENFVIAGRTSFSGRTHTTATRAKMRQTKAGTMRGESNSQYGTMWITDGTRNRKIERVAQIPTGWRKGRV